MYKIGELSKLCKLPVKTLRYYDSEGLLVPDMIDEFTGYRYYSAAKLMDCNRIIALKELGFSLEEIKKHLVAASSDDVMALIDAKREELNTSLEHILSQLRRLEAVRKSITEGEGKMFDVIIRDTDTIHVAFVRKVFDTKEEAYMEAECMKKSLPKHIVGQRILIINYETEYRENEFDLAACVEITGRLPEGCTFEERQILILEKAATLVCDRKELDEAYMAITKQLEEMPAQIVGAFYELYHEDGTVELKVPICILSRTDDRHNDDGEITEFENDPEAVGAWEFVDLVPSREQFSIYNRKYGDYENIWLKKLYFLPEGKDYWIVRGWTRNYICTRINYPAHTYKHHYTIEKNNGEMYMFIEMKNYQHESRGGKPLIYVYRKVDGREYTKFDLRIRDKVDYPFVMDEAVLGKWKSCDYGCDMKEFDPENRYWKGELFFKTVEFAADGKAVAVYGERSVELEWTKGILLDKRAEIAEAYSICDINGKEYMFIEWKNGDYQFAGRTPDYYVFERIK